MSLLKKGFCLFLPVILGSLVGFIISGSIDYNELLKPPLSPPSWLFPVMWTIIYLLMGISYYIFKKDDDSMLVSRIYYIQLIVNLLWSIIFFTLKLRLLAVLWIILLVGLVGMLIYLFWNRKRISAYLNIPYMIWILFATYLTIGIYLLN